MSWKCFKGNSNKNRPGGLVYTDKEFPDLPKRPPWRCFLPPGKVNQGEDIKYWKKLRETAQADERSRERGKSFQVPENGKGDSDIVDAVNAAIHLRRPLLVTGIPGSGKTSLAYAIAHELQLGPVLKWPITARASLMDALYSYDAIARLQDAQLDRTRQPKPQSRRRIYASKANSRREEGDLGDYLQLGPVGTAFLPSLLPRVLLIDEIDKSDLNLPNDLLNLFEEGEFEIHELVRRKRKRSKETEENLTVEVRTADKGMVVPITNGLVQCCEFPIVIMTSNGERDFPPAFYRRCLRVQMPNPTADSLVPIVESHFKDADENGWSQTKENITKLIGEFLGAHNKADRATDQLLNAIYLMTRQDSPSSDEDEMERLKALLFRRLSEGS